MQQKLTDALYSWTNITFLTYSPEVKSSPSLGFVWLRIVNGFYIFKWLKKSKEYFVKCEKNICNSSFSVYKQKLITTQVLTETVCPTNTKAFTIWTFLEKVY